jgi:gp16 family phage-associated protein
MANAKNGLTRTPEAARAALEAQGISVAAFARTHKLPYSTVYQVLTGDKKGRRGDAHRAAVLLGIKAGQIIGVESHE